MLLEARSSVLVEHRDKRQCCFQSIPRPLAATRGRAASQPAPLQRCSSAPRQLSLRDTASGLRAPPSAAAAQRRRFPDRTRLCRHGAAVAFDANSVCMRRGRARCPLGSRGAAGESGGMPHLVQPPWRHAGRAASGCAATTRRRLVPDRLVRRCGRGQHARLGAAAGQARDVAISGTDGCGAREVLEHRKLRQTLPRTAQAATAVAGA